MKDLYDREILTGDRCIRYSGWTSTLEEIIVLGEDEKGIKILNSFDKEVYTTGEKLFDFDALERQIREETFINSVKALDIKPNDRVIVSLNPNIKEIKNGSPTLGKMACEIGLDILMILKVR